VGGTSRGFGKLVKKLQINYLYSTYDVFIYIQASLCTLSIIDLIYGQEKCPAHLYIRLILLLLAVAVS